MDKATDAESSPDERRITADRSRRSQFLMFAGHWGMELLIVSAGVLIALVVQQWAENRSWRERAAISERAMDQELARAAGVLDERAMIQPCLNRRLAELDRLVRAARLSGSLPDIREIGLPPLRVVEVGAWEDAVGSGTLAHLDQQTRSMLSVNYPLIRDFPRFQMEEAASWAALRIMESVPGRTSEITLNEAAVAIAKLRWGSAAVGVTASQVRDSIVAKGIAPSYSLILDREGTRAEIAASARRRPICRPLAIGGSVEPGPDGVR